MREQAGAELACASGMRFFVVAALLVSARVAGAQMQDLGHKLPGGAGIDAGTQVEQGLYVGDRFVWFSSQRVKNRNGDTLPIEGLDLDAYANVFGVAGTLKLDRVYVTVAAAAPLVKFSLDADVPEASVDRFGLVDVFVQPIQLGFRAPHVDVIASYAFYVPTPQGPDKGFARPQWSHQLSAGGTLFLDDGRGWRVSALASYLVNQRKRDIDITRGSTVLVQGGIAGRVWRIVDLGVAGYGLWQVTDDRGSELPMELRGARERAVGLGPEIAVVVPVLRSRFNARLEWDLDGKARPVGMILVAGVSVVAWR